MALARAHGPCLRFRGELKSVSDGSREEDYHAGDPYHRLLVYEATPSGLVGIIEFHQGEQVVVDGELVQNWEELDDYFCICAADHFHGATTDRRPESAEQMRRAIRQYDRQVLDVLKAIGATLPAQSRSTGQKTRASGRPAFPPCPKGLEGGGATRGG